MIILLGNTGYIGAAFERELQRRGWPYEAFSRRQADYTRWDSLMALLDSRKPAFIVNAAGYTGKPNVDACETERADTLQGNTLFPALLAHACASRNIPWGHVSSGCIYAGAKVRDQGSWRVEKNINTKALRELFDRDPVDFAGFTEEDVPNFSFRQPPCSFYSGTKALGEESIRGVGQNYIWRLRIPFDHWDGSRNYLSKIIRYSKVYNNINSVSHRGDFVKACLDLWERRAPFGIYNVTNPGAVSTRQVVEQWCRSLAPDRKFEYWNDDAEFYQVAAKAPRSNCIMDATKLARAGVVMRPVEAALDEAIALWRPETVAA